MIEDKYINEREELNIDPNDADAYQERISRI